MIGEIRVYGASDDLIEVEGLCTLESSGTWDVSDIPVLVNGVPVLTINYDGEWTITPLTPLEGLSLHVTRSVGDSGNHGLHPDISSYSDYATITGDIRSVEVPGDTWTAS